MIFWISSQVGVTHFDRKSVNKDYKNLYAIIGKENSLEEYYGR